MNDTIDFAATAVFAGPVLTVAQGSAAAQALPGFSLAGNVAALLFDDLTASTSPAQLRCWRVQVLEVRLREPTRRRIRLDLRGALTVIGRGEARASVSCGSRRAAVTLQGRSRQVGADGGLPGKSRDAGLRLTLPRSVAPRKALRIVLLVEADAEASQDSAAATIDSVDVIAL